jgi:cytochrome c oxidase cbb3-type subunit III
MKHAAPRQAAGDFNLSRAARCPFAVIVAVAGLLCGCKREDRGFRVSPPEARPADAVAVTVLRPGGATNSPPVNNEYEQNAQALSDGKQLFQRMNCVGCHAHGGGGMGPALMDDRWIYGSNPEQIYATIVQGRPNGMPSYGGKLPNQEIWKLAAYVRSVGGLTSKDPAPGRSDHLQGKKPENSRGSQPPKPGGDLPNSPGDAP